MDIIKSITLSLLMFISGGLIAQQEKVDFRLTCGYGYFEGYNVGGEFLLDSCQQSLSFSLGYNYLKNNKEELFAMSMGYNISVFRENKLKSGNYKWWLCGKLVVWQLEDRAYIWRVLSMAPSIQRKFCLLKNVDISFDVGVAFNIVLHHKWKAYKEIGWPYLVYPNIRMQFEF